MKFLFDKKEIKIAIEAMSLCAGNCQGCFLTPEMRLDANFWSDEKLDKVGIFIKKFVDYHINNGGIDDIGITFGQGDYLQLNANQIEKILSKANDWSNSTASFFFTASGITNKQKFKDNINLFYEQSIKYKHPLTFDVVLNASKLTGKIADIYEENFNSITETFGIFDLNINMGMDIIENIPPEEFKNFLLKNKIHFVTINFLPTKYSNNTSTVKEVLLWLKEFLHISEKESYLINYLESIRRIMDSYEKNDMSFEEYLLSRIKLYTRNFYIDYYGNLFLYQEGIGDIALTDRNGYKPILNIFKEEDLNIENIILKIEDYIKKEVRNSFLFYQKDKNCSICDFQKVCMSGTGQAIKNVVESDSNIKEKDCNYGLKSFFTEIKNHIPKETPVQSPIYYQKNLKDFALQDQLKPMDYYDSLTLLRIKERK